MKSSIYNYQVEKKCFSLHDVDASHWIGVLGQPLIAKRPKLTASKKEPTTPCENSDSKVRSHPRTETHKLCMGLDEGVADLKQVGCMISFNLAIVEGFLCQGCPICVETTFFFQSTSTVIIPCKKAC